MGRFQPALCLTNRAAFAALILPVALLDLLLARGLQAQASGGIAGKVSSSVSDKVVYVDGRHFSFTGTGVQAAITAACTGNVPGKVVLPAQAITGIASRLLVTSSNCTIEGEGKNVSVLQASSGYSGGGMLATGDNLSHLRFVGFGVDGNRANNSNVFDCMDISGTDIVMDGVRASNCQNQGLLISGGSGNWKILKSEFDHDGSNIAIEGTGGIRINPGGAVSISAIQIGPGNSVHDNNTGIAVLPPSSQSNQTNDVSVFENEIYSNASDGIVVTANLPTGGAIVGFSARGNTIWCNGWTGEPFPGCTPGFLQTRSAGQSSSGVGIDIIQLGSGLMLRPIIQRNNIHDNTYEAVALTSYCWSTVSTSGRRVTQTGPSGFTKGTCRFNMSWKAGEQVIINNAAYLVDSVLSSTSLMLQSSAPSQVGVGFAGNASMHAIVSDNQAFRDGSGNVGPCFFDSWTSDVKFSNNVGKGCNLEGYLAGGSDISFGNDEAISNGKSGIAGRTSGFNLPGCFACSLVGVTADDQSSSPTQTVGVLLSPTRSNTRIVPHRYMGRSVRTATRESITGLVWLGRKAAAGFIKSRKMLIAKVRRSHHGDKRSRSFPVAAKAAMKGEAFSAAK